MEDTVTDANVYLHLGPSNVYTELNDQRHKSAYQNFAFPNDEEEVYYSTVKDCDIYEHNSPALPPARTHDRVELYDNNAGADNLNGVNGQKTRYGDNAGADNLNGVNGQRTGYDNNAGADNLNGVNGQKTDSGEVQYLNIVKGHKKRCQCPCWVIVVAVCVGILLGVSVAVVVTLQMTKENAGRITEMSPTTTIMADEKTSSITGESIESTTAMLYETISSPSPCDPHPCPCPGGYTLQPCADVYLPMDLQVGDTVRGYGMDGRLTGTPGWGAPEIIQNIGVLGNALHITQEQWVDLGLHNDRCLGRLTNCDSGFTFATYFKLEGGRKWKVLFQNVGYYYETPGVKLMLIENPTWDNDPHITFDVGVFTSTTSFSRQTKCQGNYHTGWHHVALTVNLDKESYQLYCDGEFKTDNSFNWHNTYTPGTNDSNVLLGYFTQYPTEYFTGHIDETFIWESWQPKETIDKLYERGKDTNL